MHAHTLARCHLYWLPSDLPASTRQRRWTIRFVRELVKKLAPSGEMQPELFVEYDAIYPDRNEEFIQTALDFNPVMGFSRAPGASLPSIPNVEHIDAVRRQEKPFVLKSFLRGVSYWFMAKQFDRQLDLFWGFGGVTVFLVKPDPAAKPPPLAIPAGVKKHPAFQDLSKQHDLQALLGMAYAVQAGFLKKSRDYFGTGWESRVEYRGLQFIVPRWTSQHFFGGPQEDLDHLFEISEVFITESPPDGGVLLASSRDLRAVICDTVVSLQEAGEAFVE